MRRFEKAPEVEPVRRKGAPGTQHARRAGGLSATDSIARGGLDARARSMPFASHLLHTFGPGALDGVLARDAPDANARLGSLAYAFEGTVAFGASTPDLRTTAHELAHVHQLRAAAGVRGAEPSEAFERHADAVADRAVRGESAADLLGRMPAGRPPAVQMTFTKRLDEPLSMTDIQPKEAPPGAEGNQRIYIAHNYITMWEEAHGRSLTPEERRVVLMGCIGVTTLNLTGTDDKPDTSNAYWSHELAIERRDELNALLDALRNDPVAGIPYFPGRAVMFAKRFWSNQSEDKEARRHSDPTAFIPNFRTGEIDMSGDRLLGQNKTYATNFDYGFWDDHTNSYWHATQGGNAMEVLQSTRERFEAENSSWDRIVYCVAISSNFDPYRAAAATAR